MFIDFSCAIAYAVRLIVPVFPLHDESAIQFWACVDIELDIVVSTAGRARLKKIKHECSKTATSKTNIG
jgi:hypothetical protein